MKNINIKNVKGIKNIKVNKELLSTLGTVVFGIGGMIIDSKIEAIVEEKKEAELNAKLDKMKVSIKQDILKELYDAGILVKTVETDDEEEC